MFKGKSTRDYILFISFFIFLICISRANSIKPPDTYILNNLLLKDYYKLKEHNNSTFLKTLSPEEFVALFHEGIEASISFIENYKKPGKMQDYNNKIKQVITFHKRSKNQHKIHAVKLNFDLNKTSFENNGNREHIFKAFSGKWFGFWKSTMVKHHWLLPREFSKIKLPYSNRELILNYYQSAFTGDGFGWNYQIKMNGKSFLVGYVCHFDENGHLCMKRPHIGVLQKNNAIIWITKDHIYYEFICKGGKHHNGLPPHYVITGAYFKNGMEMSDKTVMFQEIYTEDVMDRITLLIGGISMSSHH